MNSKERAIVNAHRIKIIQDLHDDVTFRLYEINILTYKEYSDIINLTKQKDKNEQLLDVILGKCNGFEQLQIATKVWYPWIFNLLHDIDNTVEDDYLLAIEGGVPPVPLHNVTRRGLLENVCGRLRELKRGHYLVLNGMIGCGKSCLAAESLNQSVVKECFKGKVFWLSAGKEASDDVWGLQAELYEHIFTDELNRDVKRAHAQLKNRFKKEEYKDSLLVLDDVASQHVIDALDICCKILITTNDQSVMRNRESRTTFIKVEEGFTEKETLQLLAQCVSVDVSMLPPQAKLIYQQSKGYPMTVSLIGAQLSEHREEAMEVPKSWDLYVQSLNNKDIGNIKRRSLVGNHGIKPTIDLCIGKLEEELQKYYQDFALFVEDVNIKPEVLQTLWSISEYRLKNEVMAEFVRKSLVVRKWNPKLNSYVYGIHDLLLEYLRDLLSDEQKHALHEKLINCYKRVCGGDFSKLPQNDNYIFYYLGYHLKEAHMFSLFPELYFNLEFIEAKLRSVGPADLLSDYRKYREYIIDRVAQNVDKVQDFELFIERAGQSIRRLKDIDIVQFALQEHRNSYVFKAAFTLARKRQNKKYIQFLLGAPDSRVAPQVIQYQEHITAACFSDVKSNIIVAGESGRIQILDNKGLTLRTFEGHDKKITHLALSKNEQYFLSTSEDFTIKVWKLIASDSPMNGIHSNGYGNNNRTPSPRQRQTGYSELWNVNHTGEPYAYNLNSHRGIVVCAEFSPDSKKIVSASCDKTIKVWCLSGVNGTLIINILNLTSEPRTCTFSNCGDFIFYSGNDSQVVVRDAVSTTILASFTSSFPIKSLYAVTRDGEKEVILLTDYSVCSHSVHAVDVITADKKVTMFKDYSRKQFEQFLCCAVPQDGSYIAVAVSNHKILLCEPRGQVIREFHEPNGNPICLAADNRSNHLLGIYPDQIIRLWKVEVILGELPTALKCNFHCIWPSEGHPFIAVPTNRNSVKVLCGRDVRETYTFDKREVITCAITQDLAHVICGCDDGSVWHTVNGKLLLSMTLSSAVYSVRGYEMYNNLVIVAMTGHNQLKIWNGGQEKEIDIGSKDCIHFFVLPSSNQLLTICRDFSIKKWLIGHKVDRNIEMEIICQQRFDGELVASALNCNYVLAVVDNKRSLLQLQNVSANHTSGSHVFHLAAQPTTCNFSPDGTVLAVGLYNGAVQIFSVDERGLMQESWNVKISSGPIQSLCVGNEGILGIVCQHTVAIIPSGGEQIAQVQLSAKLIDKAPGRDEFVTIDTEGNIHLLALLDNQTDNRGTRRLLHLNLNNS